MLKILLNAVVFILFSQTTFPLQSDNKCKEFKVHHELKEQCVDTFEVQITYESCMDPVKAFKCEQRTRVPKTECKYINHTTMKQEEVCCEGYTEVNDNCIAVCVPECSIHGFCVMPPSVCQCDDGYTGDRCELKGDCSVGWYGEGCLEACHCNRSNLLKCHRETGSCICRPGYEKDCSKKCEKFRYGSNCKYKCQCNEENSEGCDRVTGECLCKYGFEGNRCQHKCPKGQTGVNCEEDCKCFNGHCTHNKGECDCEPGFMGRLCNEPCPNLKYGKNCTYDCPICYNDGHCSSTTGKCECKFGYIGEQCQNTCEPGEWGKNCANKCQCKNEMNCNSATGKCQCLKYFSGKLCEIRNCPKGRYGYLCEDSCLCSKHSKCNQVNGSCTCDPGYTGKHCNDKCHSNYYGKDCKQVCNCSREMFCHWEEGCKIVSSNIEIPPFNTTMYFIIILGFLLLGLLIIVAVFISLKCRSSSRNHLDESAFFNSGTERCSLRQPETMSNGFDHIPRSPTKFLPPPPEDMIVTLPPKCLDDPWSNTNPFQKPYSQHSSSENVYTELPSCSTFDDVDYAIAEPEGAYSVAYKATPDTYAMPK